MPGSTMAVMATTPDRNRYAASTSRSPAMFTVNGPVLPRRMVRVTTNAVPSSAKGRFCRRRRAAFSARATKGMETTVRPRNRLLIK